MQCFQYVLKSQSTGWHIRLWRTSRWHQNKSSVWPKTELLFRCQQEVHHNLMCQCHPVYSTYFKLIRKELWHSLKARSVADKWHQECEEREGNGRRDLQQKREERGEERTRFGPNCTCGRYGIWGHSKEAQRPTSPSYTLVNRWIGTQNWIMSHI